MGRVQLGMPEELLNLLQRHAVFQKRGGDGVPQRMRRDSFGDAGEISRFLHQLLDTPRRKGRVTVRLEQISLGSITQMSAELLSQFRQDRHVAALASFSLTDEDHLLVKKEVLDLNRDLFLLEEELLYPSTTQLAVFVSMDVGAFFELDSVQLKIDDQEVASYLYTDRQVDALHRGGVHRLFTGNVRVGEHEVAAFFTGKGPNGRDYRRSATRVIVKDVGPRFVELRIEDRSNALQPEFAIREW